MPEQKFIYNSNQDLLNLKSTGTPIGLIQDSIYKLDSLDFNSQDKIFLYTDGLENNFYKKNPNLFNQELNQILLNTQAINSSSTQILNLIFNKFYQEPLSKNKTNLNLDDTSLILLELN
jgi:serine phosphatase RsbU (regulator of sigma subunit)